MLYSALFALGGSSQALPALVGAALAKRLSLGLVKEASDENLRFFSDASAKTLVVENLKAKQTLVASSDKKQLRLLAEPPPPPQAKPASKGFSDDDREQSAKARPMTGRVYQDALNDSLKLVP